MASAVFAVSACGNDYSNVATYDIEAQQCNKPFKCSFDVRIKDQLSEQDLSLVSNKIKDESPVVDNLFISYYLPCMKIGNGSWATARFTPELSLSVQSYMLTENPSCQAKENE